MHSSCLEFGNRILSEGLVKGKRVIEVGSLDVNGSLRPIVEALGPLSYVGVDISSGKGVDQICSAEQLVSRFGLNSFDFVICTEVLEHVRNWRNVVHNLKQILSPNARLLITTRSMGFGLHGYPFDFWRYEISDMQNIFSDLFVESLETDPKYPGVFMLACKPLSFIEKDLGGYNLYSMLSEKRSNITSTITFMPMLYFRRLLKTSRAIYYITHATEIPNMLARRIRDLLTKIRDVL